MTSAAERSEISEHERYEAEQELSFKVGRLVDKRRRIGRKLHQLSGVNLGEKMKPLQKEISAIEKNIKKMGFELTDSNGGTTWRRKDE